MRLILCFLSLFLSSAVLSNPVKIYDIYNVSNVEFVPRTSENTRQCQEFTKIPPSKKVAKFIDFNNADRINCIALNKKDETCGLIITLNAKALPQVEPFGNCRLATRAQKEAQSIDRLFIGFTQ